MTPDVAARTPLARPGAEMGLDRAGFQALFASQRDRLFRLLYRLTGRAADADDLLQEAFLATWRKRRQFDARGSAEGWLVRTAFRLYLNHRHKASRRLRLAGRVDPLPEGAAARRVGSAERDDALAFVLPRVRAAIQELPEGPREAFVLFRLEGMSVRDIADLCDVPPKTIETRVRRATQLLAERLGDLKSDLPPAE